MKKTILSFGFLIIALQLGAQNLQWAKTIGGPLADNGNCIVTDPSGNIYITGDFSGTMDFDPGPGTYNLTATSVGYDAYIVKLDVFANFKWAKRMGANQDDGGSFIAVDTNGNVYLAGEFHNTVDFNPGAGTFNLTSNSGSWDIFLLKLDSIGNFVWAKSLSSYNTDASCGLVLDPFGDIILTGYFDGPADFDPNAGSLNINSSWLDIFVWKLNSSGNLKWAVTCGGTSSDIGWGIDTDPHGNVYVTGRFGSTVDFDPGAGVQNLTSTALDPFLLKLDSAGNYIAAYSWGGSNSDDGIDIELDKSGNIYLMGTYQLTADIDPTAGVNHVTAVGNSDIYISKMDSTGNFIWGKSFGGSDWDIGTELSMDTLNNIYYGGYFLGTSDFDPGIGVYNLTSAGNHDMAISKLDPDGNFIWADRFGDTNTDIPWSIHVDVSGNVFSTGWFSGNVDFDPTAGITMVSSIGGSGDPVLLKLCQSGPTNAPGAISGITVVCPGATNSYQIDPILEAGSYVWTLPGGWTGTSTTNSINATSGASGGNISVMGVSGCDSTVTTSLLITVISCMGIEGSGTSSIGIYPNPTHEFIHITGLNAGIQYYSLVNLFGEQVQTGQIVDDGWIDVKWIPSGTYFLRMDNHFWKIVKVD